MPHNKAPQAKLSTVARFPVGYLLENLVVRSDNSVLISGMNHKELWFVPPSSTAGEVVEARCLYTFEELPTGIVEVEPDLFLIFTGNWYTTHESYAYRLDLNAWSAGTAIAPERLCQFPAKARGLNGCCLLSSGVVLVADCFASLIWRFDFSPGATSPKVSVWMTHESMGYFPGAMKPEQPGVNGIRYAGRTQTLYYTDSAKKLLMSVRVHPETLQPSGAPALVVAGRMGDDFCIDENAGVMYLTTHRQNTIDLISLQPALNSGFTQSVAGIPFSEALIGPSSAAWRRGQNDYGHVLYCLMDGGTASPPPGGPKAAELLRVELAPLPAAFPGSAS